MTWTNTKNSELRERAQRVIPNGMYGHESTILLPDEYPQFFARGEGSHIWDVDGNKYVDMMCAYGPNLLGYGFESVERAAAEQQARGDTLTGPSEVMVTLAETMVDMVSHADWAMFCKNGTDATSIAIVAARAHTGRRKILYAKGTYHGAAAWCTPRANGVLPEDRAHIVYYEYNDLESLEAAFKEHADDVAGVLATPFVHEVFRDQALAEQEFARGARELCDKYGALLILDEVRAGLRLARDCGWEQYGVRPDLSCWGKCIANGYPISAVLGSDSVRKGATEIYVTGSFWFSAVPMAAAVETLRQVRETDYLERTIASGQRLRDGLQQQAASHGFTLRQSGPVQMPQILFEEDPDFRIGYGWAAAALKGGAYLHPFHNMFVSSAHTLDDMSAILHATDLAFETVKKTRDSLKPHPILMALFGHH